MKTITMLAVVLSLVFAVGLCQAETISVGEVLEKVPAVNMGIGYSVLDSEFKPLTTVTVYSIDKLAVDVGVTSSKESLRISDNTTVIGQISYNLIKAKDVSIIKDIPIINLLEITPAAWAGYDRIGIGNKAEGNNEFDAGVGLKLISIKK